MATKKKKTTAKRTRTAGKKTAAKKRSTKKKPTRGAAAARKKSSKKKKPATRPARKKTVKKKSASKKSAAKKKSTKKKSAKKKTSKKTAQSSTKKTTTKKAPSKKKVEKTGAQSKKKKKTSKKADSGKSESKAPAKGKNKRSQSVVEAASGAEVDKHGYVFINGRRVRMISTQGKGVSPKSKKVRAQQVEDDQPIAVKLGKSNLSKKELRHYRDLLLIKRAELVGDLTSLEAEALRSSGGNISHMPIHMADVGSDTYEQDFMLGMAETERKQIREIDDALMRIKEGTYGVCQMTGETIPKARLDAKPWAKYTIEAARKMEGHWQP